MNTNRWLKALALAMSVLMIMTAIAIPTFADETDPYADFDKWDGVDYAEEFWAQYDATADGSGKDPIIIDTAAKLAGLAKKVNDAGIGGSVAAGAFKNQEIYVTKNLDMQNMPMQSIGLSYNKAHFSGLFEGRLNGEEGVAPTIANVIITERSDSNSGFIGNLRGGTAKCFTLENAIVGNKNTSGVVGVAVGYASKQCEVSDITVINSQIICGSRNDSNAGGAVVGSIKADCSQTLSNLVAIDAKFVVPAMTAIPLGGIVGLVEGRTGVEYNFENCYFSGKAVTAVENAASEHILTDIYFGGILGSMKAENDVPAVIMKNCQFNGELLSALANNSRLGMFGAFVANAAAGSVKLENCLNSGKIASYMECVGMVGETGSALTDLTITNCYSVATNSVATTNGSASATVSVVTPAAITGDAAKTALAGFDFDNVWTANAGKLPTLAGIEDAVWADVATAGDADVIEDVVPAPDQGDSNNQNNNNNQNNTNNNQNNTEDKKNDAPATDNTAAPAKKGCFGVISSTALVALLTVGLGVTVIRKKED